MVLLSTKKELEVMEILWNTDEPLPISRFPEINSSLKTTTLNIVLKKLYDAGYIYVADLAKTKTVYARAYKAAMTREECIAKELGEFDENKLSVSMVSNVLKNTEGKEREQFIQEIESVLAQYKTQE